MSNVIAEFIDGIASYLLVASIFAAALPLIAWTIIKVARIRSSVYRHMIWLHCLIGIAVLPILYQQGAKLTLTVLPAKAETVEVTASPAVTAGDVMPFDDYLPVEDGQPKPSHAAAVTTSSGQSHLFRAKTVWVCGWLILLAFMLLRLAVGWRRLHQICRSAKPLCDIEGLDDQPAGQVRVLVTSQVECPACFGVLRPAILLPRSICANSTAAERRMVLSHELAHVERRDGLVNLFQRLLEAVMFFHPFVWYASYQLTQQREEICDSYVLARGASAGAYSTLLARWVDNDLPKRHLRAVGLFEGRLLQRIRRLLDPGRGNRTRASRRIAAVCTLAAVVSFVAIGTIRLEAKSKTDTKPVAVKQESQTYEVSLPEEWKQYLSVGELTVTGKPFYGVRDKFFGLFPLVRIHWSLKNLTSQPLFLKVNYGSRNPKGKGGSGFGVGYVLKAHEEYRIEDVVPVFSVKLPAALRIHLIKLWLPGRTLNRSSSHLGVQTELLEVSAAPPGAFGIISEDDRRLELKRVRLMSLEDQRNALEITVANKTKQSLEVNIEVAVGDTVKADNATPGINPLSRSKGSFSAAAVTVPQDGKGTVRLPYSVPSDAGEKPVLVFRVFEANQNPDAKLKRRLGLTEKELRVLRYGRVISVGCLDLREAAEKGEVKLPVNVPVKERATLTAEKRSKHFLFRYRPDSYAARNMDTVIKLREEAHDRLSDMLKMELPVTVTIDLYPDMEAKALGSGTKWTPANTVNNRHIAEVYNEAYQCDAYHELTHIFSYHFGGGGGGLCEAFAAYCEPDADMAEATQRPKQKLEEGKLRPLHEILRVTGNGDENMAFIDYLLKRDLETFKKFYVSTTRAKNVGDLEKAAREVFKKDLKALERQWHEYLKR